MSIKKILEEANRYNGVISIIESIISSCNTGTLPVKAFVTKQGTTEWRVSASMVNQEAIILLKTIEEEDEKSKSESDFSNLFQYIHSTTDMLLHNYAVSISHRKVPETNMDDIRIWEILDNMLMCWDFEDDEEWYIPDGWKKVKDEDEDERYIAEYSAQ